MIKTINVYDYLTILLYIVTIIKLIIFSVWFFLIFEGSRFEL